LCGRQFPRKNDRWEVKALLSGHSICNTCRHHHDNTLGVQLVIDPDLPAGTAVLGSSVDRVDMINIGTDEKDGSDE
jgi:hypothetical protein